MYNPSAALASAPDMAIAAQAQDAPITVETRYGEVSLRPDRTVVFPRGLLGFGDHQTFGLAELPDTRLARFKLLQSLDDEQMSFLVLPLDPDAGLIAPSDLTEACRALGIDGSDVALLVIVSARKGPDGIAITVNLRAPLVIDTRQMFGVQYVLPNNSYSIRHPL